MLSEWHEKSHGTGSVIMRRGKQEKNLRERTEMRMSRKITRLKNGPLVERKTGRYSKKNMKDGSECKNDREEVEN